MKHFLLSLSFVLFSSMAYAQSCGVEYEVVQTLKDPRYGAPSITEGIIGDMHTDIHYKAVIANNDSTSITAGIIQMSGKDQIDLVMTTLDRRSRVTLQKVIPVRDLVDVIDMTAQDDGWIVLVKQKAKGKQNFRASLLKIGSDFTLQSTYPVDVNIDPQSLLRLKDGSFRIAGDKMEKGVPTYGVLYGFSKGGSKLFKRTYQPGGYTTLLNLSPIKNDLIAATGHLTDEENRQAAWVMILNADGEIIWQNRYARGKAARVLDAAQVDDQTLVITGQVVPERDDVNSAAWIAALDMGTSTVKWERFYDNKRFHNAAHKIMSLDGENVMSILIRSKPAYPAQGLTDSFARLLTMNMRGNLFDVQDFSSSNGVKVFDMTYGQNRSRVFAGTTQKKYEIVSAEVEEETSDEPSDAIIVEESEFVTAENGWLLTIPGPEIYDDPCLSKMATQPAATSPAAGPPAPTTVFP